MPPEPRPPARLLAGGGLIGFVAAFVLLVEKIALLKDPTYEPSCSINPVLSCGSVMKTAQAEVFGFPNPMLGIAGFAVVTTVGLALAAGARFARWFWIGLQVGLVLGLGLVHWLIFQSVFRIGALCPYCLVVWVVTIALFVRGTSYIVRSGHLGLPRVVRGPAVRAIAYDGVILTAWYLAIASVITIQFWTYWQTLLP